MPSLAENSQLIPLASGGRIGDIINDLIRSGKYRVFFNALKAFRNGVVYGARTRAPHALIVNLVWSHAPWSVIIQRVFQASLEHALVLGLTGFTYTLLHSLLHVVQGNRKLWHSAVAGYIVGFLFCGRLSPVTAQINMYILSRIISAVFFVLVRRFDSLTAGNPASGWAFRLYSGVLWMILMPLFLRYRDFMQSSMRNSLTYIFVDSEQYSSLYDLLCMNSDTSF
ncbi:putative Tim17 Tim22 Tim23 Pmp24 family [Trypanosoma vivax]|uniref:Putative peroxisomal membrane protein 4 n=1 Tax=Trypanosoma vivax (strain Y486) TaxID=1055687 RepID=G0U1Q9_TRYVY|nr:putative peroxisomal membrane protein 4 [Trypanosoma vivax]KAH8618836.1 putative Tim17 Tim22 Tim23 Pmp24 family [Trypanosoma vivax]CCC50206.1 putative peroxisomal membrane protein 4 [Trypanosoma vivax Y486]